MASKYYIVSNWGDEVLRYKRLSDHNTIWQKDWGGTAAAEYYKEDDSVMAVRQANATAYKLDASTGSISASATPFNSDSSDSGFVDQSTGRVCVTQGSQAAILDSDLNTIKTFDAGNFVNYTTYEDSAVDGNYFIGGGNQFWDLYEIDTGNRIKRVENGVGNVVEINADNGYAYVSWNESGQLIQYDYSEDNVRWSIQVPIYATAIKSDGDTVFAGYEAESRIDAIDVDDGTVKASYSTSNNGIKTMGLGAQEIISGSVSNSRYSIIDRQTGNEYYNNYSGPNSMQVTSGGKNFDRINFTGEVFSASDGSSISTATVTVKETGANAATDNSGQYTLALEPGQYTLEANSPDYEPKEATIDTDDTNVTNFALNPSPSTVNGIVTDANNDPVQGVEIVDNYGNSVETAVDGTYSLEVPPNTTVQVGIGAGFSVYEFSTDAGSVHNDKNFQYGGASITVNRPNGSGLPDVDVGFGDIDEDVTSGTGVASSVKLPSYEIPITINGVDIGETVTPSPGVVETKTVEVGKVLDITVKDSSTLEPVEDVDVIDISNESSNITDINGKATLFSIQPDGEVRGLVATNDRRYLSLLVAPELPGGADTSTEVFLKTKDNIGNL